MDAQGNPVTRGTVKDSPKFNARLDANALYQATSYTFGADETAIINVLSHRSNKQRQEIKKEYKGQYGKELESVMKGALKGNFENAIVALLLTPAEYDADEIYSSLEASGVDEMSVLEILYTRTNEEIRAIKQEYEKRHKKDLGKHVESKTNGNLQKLLVNLALGGTVTPDCVTKVDLGQVMKDAEVLKELTNKNTDTQITQTIFEIWMRSRPHLRAVNREYRKLQKESLEKHIKSLTKGQYSEALVAMLHAACDEPSYFAERLRWSMGYTNNYGVLIRVIVTRSEKDMVQIKEEFRDKYDKNLKATIEKEVWGWDNTDEILLAIIADKCY